MGKDVFDGQAAACLFFDAGLNCERALACCAVMMAMVNRPLEGGGPGFLAIEWGQEKY